jgi:hypothetical protein
MAERAGTGAERRGKRRRRLRDWRKTPGREEKPLQRNRIGGHKGDQARISRVEAHSGDVWAGPGGMKQSLHPSIGLDSGNAAGRIARLLFHRFSSILAAADDGSPVIDERPNTADLGQAGHRPGQILRFRARRFKDPESPGDLRRFEREDPMDYRHRMLVNALVIGIVVLLISAGVWIADTIGEMQHDQDCIMQGRTNCAPLGTR